MKAAALVGDDKSSQQMNYKLNAKKFGKRCEQLVAQCSNLDAREFIRKRMASRAVPPFHRLLELKLILEQANSTRRRVHVIMNLPAR